MMGKNATLLSDRNVPRRRCSTTKKAWNRGQLLRLLESTRLITRISIDSQTGLVVDHAGWDEYWLPVKEVEQFDGFLEQLKAAWSAYVNSGFEGTFRREYCLRYFELLGAVTDARLANAHSVANSETLHRVLAFETFGISLVGQSKSVVAGATSTLRHPAYLLTKLKTPGVLDTGEHLPLILPTQSPAGTLYYHYRQHRLSRNSDMAILSYLATNHEMRCASFRAIGMLEQGLSEATDPFASERAERLARAGICEYLRAWCRERKDIKVPVHLLDLGAGSGLVAARVCGEIIKTLAELRRHPRLRIWLIDLAMSDPERFFSSKKIEQYVDSIQVIGADYRKWVEQSDKLPTLDGIRVVLMSRFFNNLSDFSIQPWTSNTDSGKGAEALLRTVGECYPTHCLAEGGPGPERLVASNTRMRLAEGRTFRQFSLSPYFAGLSLALDPNGSDMRRETARQPAFLPVRTFRPDCLLTQSGDSLLGALARQSHLVVIQDADMSPEDMKAHCHSAKLNDLTALDTTRMAGLRGHFSYVIGKRADPVLSNIGGDRIW